MSPQDETDTTVRTGPVGADAPTRRSRPARWLFIGGLAVVIVLAALALALPLARGLQDAGPTRDRGKLPDLGALLGQDRRGVERALGSSTKVGEYRYSDMQDPAHRPQGVAAASFAVYALPDLNRLADRPLRRLQLAGESLDATGRLAPLAPSSWKSDADVVVYFSAKGEAVAVRLDVSSLAARGKSSRLSTATVLAATGLAGHVGTAGGFAHFARASRVATGTSAAAGRVVVGARTVDYLVRVGGMSGYLLDFMPDVLLQPRDSGDVMVLAVLPTPAAQATESTDATRVGFARQTPAAADQAEPATRASEPTIGAPVRGRQAHNGEEFWIAVCAKAKSPKDAQAVADRLNDHWKRVKQKADGPFAVERSGHLSGLGGGDYWVVIYDRAFGEKNVAQRAVSKDLGFLAAQEATLYEVTKRCGDSTISSVTR